jgi:hypothetical protein
LLAQTARAESQKIQQKVGEIILSALERDRKTIFFPGAIKQRNRAMREKIKEVPERGVAVARSFDN